SVAVRLPARPGPGPVGQAARRARPLPRRAEMIARPARVRMRRRKPWVFARRRVFGVEGGLLTAGPRFVCFGGGPAPAGQGSGGPEQGGGGRVSRGEPAV